MSHNGHVGWTLNGDDGFYTLGKWSAEKRKTSLRAIQGRERTRTKQTVAAESEWVSFILTHLWDGVRGWKTASAGSLQWLPKWGVNKGVMGSCDEKASANEQSRKDAPLPTATFYFMLGQHVPGKVLPWFLLGTNVYPHPSLPHVSAEVREHPLPKKGQVSAFPVTSPWEEAIYLIFMFGES